MITAKEARKMSRDQNLSEMRSIENEIKKATDEGKLFAFIYKSYINIDVIYFLNKNGYTVSKADTDDYYTISWEDAEVDED